MNILTAARNNAITPEMQFVAEAESLSVEAVRDSIARGHLVVLKNGKSGRNPAAVGKGTRTKINANIGSSPDHCSMDEEINKLHAAIAAGADAIMDLSIGGDITAFRERIIAETTVPIGTVPLYEVAAVLSAKHRSIIDMGIGDFLEIIVRQAQAGVDFMTIHSGITRESLASLKSHKRIVGITSRGGSIIAEWIARNKMENPLYEHYDEILAICAEYNIAISLGDGLRPGCIHDASDRGQVHEMIVLGDLARRARERGVQAIIEGPGHVSLDMIADNIRLEKSLCDGAPYYVLGPLVTDIAPGYDHITSAIGGAIAGASGADFLCYVTPAEHLRLPTIDDVREGVIASKIAAHAADLVKNRERAIERDNAMATARKKRDWEAMFRLSVDPDKARRYRHEIPSDEGQCSMCGEFCAIKRNTGIDD